MTRIKTAFISAALALGLVGSWGFIQWLAKNRLNAEVQRLRLQSEQMEILLAENARLSNLVARASVGSGLNRDPSSELLRLRGEVGRLRQEVGQLQSLNAAAIPKPEANASTSPVEKLNIDLPRTSWIFVGYDSPEAALQSLMWARREGDTKSLLACLTPTFIENAQKNWGDQYEEELKSELPGKINRVSEFSIVSREMVSDTEARLTCTLVEKEEGRNSATTLNLTARLVGNEWKLAP